MMLLPRVVCIHTGNKYGLEYPVRLHAGLTRNTNKPFAFEMITREEFPGWWQKLLLFPPTSRIIYLDLDVVITGNVDFLFDYDGPFCIWRDPQPIKYNSSVMSIDKGYGWQIRKTFLIAPHTIMQEFYGDQEFITYMVKDADTWQDVAPGKVKSYKCDRMESGPGDASIVVFHGDPKPHTFKDGWVKEYWRE